MTTLPPIGSRVVYTRKPTRYMTGLRTCTGTVTAHYPGGEKLWDDEKQEEYVAPDHVLVRVDKPLPEWWAYTGTDLFAPSVDEVEVVK